MPMLIRVYSSNDHYPSLSHLPDAIPGEEDVRVPDEYLPSRLRPSPSTVLAAQDAHTAWQGRLSHRN